MEMNNFILLFIICVVSCICTFYFIRFYRRIDNHSIRDGFETNIENIEYYVPKPTNIIVKSGITKYWLLERDGAAIYKTPEELLEQIINDSKSDYYWITGPEQLYNCIHIDGFPDDIRQQIMSLIMKCYTNLETTDYIPNHQDILNEIFHELKDDEIKSNYLKAVIFEITQYDSAGLARNIDYISDLFKEKENRWKKEMYTKYWEINYNINLKTIRGRLQTDYDDFLEKIKSNPNITIAEKEINDIINKETAEFVKKIRDIPYQGDNQY